MFFLLCTQIPIGLRAQNTTYFPMYSQAAFDAKAIDLLKPVGTVPGGAEVSHSGASTYTIPIFSSPGTNGVQPKMSISYNSQGGNGNVGFGWQISGISAINRTNKNHHYDDIASPVQLEDNDAIALDGSRLMLDAGSNLTIGASYKLEQEDYSVVSCLQHPISGLKYFKVEAKDGSFLEYGSSVDSRFTTQNGKVVAWYLKRAFDRNGNYMEYEYQQSVTHNEIWLRKVKYTGNLNAGLIPYNEIQFTYTDRFDPQVFYVGGEKFMQTKLLQSVSSIAENQHVQTIDLKYGKDDLYSYLIEVGLKGEVLSQELNTTIFRYGEAQANIYEPSWALNDILLENQFNPYELVALDTDGDGRSSIMTIGTVTSTIGGVTDETNVIKLFKQSSNMLYSYSHQYTKTFPSNVILPKKKSKNYNNRTSYSFGKNDFNGDGKDDIVYINFTTSGVSLLPATVNSINIMYSDNASTFNEISYLPTPNYNKIASIVSGPNTFYTNYFFAGDFNGDGKSDYLTMLADNNNINKIHYSSPSNNQMNIPVNYYCNSTSSCIYSNEEIHVIDFNGDGKSELMTIHQGESRIFTVEPDVNNELKFVLLYQSGYPTIWNDVYFADFNGDAKTDLLCRANTDWYISYSTGTNFETLPFTFNPSVNIQDLGNNAQQIVVEDFNGDGKSDILHTVKVSSPSSQTLFNFYYSSGGSFQYNQVAYNGHISNQRLSSLDCNGDGKIDLINKPLFQNPAILPNLLVYTPNTKERLLHSTKDGAGIVNSFQYKYLTESSIYWKTPNTSVSQNLNAHYPLNTFQGALTCVSAYIQPDGIGGTHSTQFNYHNAMIHRAGKGFLGFKEVKRSNSTLNTMSVVLSEFDPVYFIPLLQKTEEWSVNPLLTKEWTHYTNTVQSISPKRYSIHVDHIYKMDMLSHAEYTTINTYDNYNNITNQVVHTDALETTTTNTQYGGSPVPWQPTQISVTKGRVNKPTINTESSIVYNALGRVSVKSDNINLPETTNTFFNYDMFGNVQETAVASVGMPYQKLKELKYDSKGRFVVESKIVSASGNPTETASYEPKWGNVLEAKSADCKTTTYLYDAFGRRIRTLDAALIAMDVSRGWHLQPLNSYTMISTHTFHLPSNAQVAPDTKAYFDLLGRNTKTETQGFDANNNTVWITETTAYNNKGLLESKTAPKLQAEQIFTTTYTYDYLHRLKTTDNPQASSQVDYAYNTTDHLLTVTTTNTTANQAKSSTTDASGKLVQAEDAGGLISYDYDSRGNQIEIKQGPILWLSRMKYDDYGRQIELEERNSGKTFYEYDAFGQMVKQTNANGHIAEMKYDELGRIIDRTGPEGSTTYEYLNDVVNGCNRVSNAISKIQGFSNDLYEYNYDAIARETEKKTTINGNAYTNNYVYNPKNQLSSEILPGGLELRYDYTNTGFVKSTYTDPNNIYYTELAKNGLGQTTRYRLANNILSDIVYQQGVLQQKNTSGIQNDQYIFNLGTGNLTSRTNSIYNLTETFEYDDLNRLTKAHVQGLQPITYEYANVNNANTLGNIKKSSFLNGNYSYFGLAHNAVDKIDNPNSTTLPPDHISVNAQEIIYTAFNRPEAIDENGHHVQYTYGADYERIISEYTDAGVPQCTKYYLGQTEVLQVAGQPTRYVYYISGDAGLAAIVVRNEIGNNSVYPTYTDHLGSINVVTNKQGAIVARQNYDAWGNARHPLTWGYASMPAVPDWLYRGYTGHEHLPQFALINMNARLYDPAIGRMLSPDIYVQSPTSTQSYNRYSYSWNNPLKYTDPSGNVVGAIYFGMCFIGDAASQLISGNSQPFLNAYNNASEIYSAFSGMGRTTIYSNGAHTITGGLDIFSVGLSINYTYSEGDWSASASAGVGFIGGFNGGVGVGYSLDDVTFGISGGLSNSMVGSGFLHSYGASVTYCSPEGVLLGYGINRYGINGDLGAQTTGSLRAGFRDFSVTHENDFLSFSGDRYRTAALAISYKQLSAGFDVYTNDPLGIEDVNKNYRYKGKKDDPLYSSGIWGPNNRWTKRGYTSWGEYGGVYQSSLFFQVADGNTISRVGYSFKGVQDFTQNGIHTSIFKPGNQNYYLNYTNFYRGFTGYNGYIRPYSIYGR